MTVQALDLDRRLSRAIENGRGIKLSAADVRLLNELGAFDLLFIALADDGTDPIVPARCNRCDPFIYFMQGEQGGPVKIGLTRKPEQRRVEHQSSSPYLLRFLALFRAPPEFEKALHAFYGAERVRGEWFHPSQRLLRFAERVGLQS